MTEVRLHSNDPKQPTRTWTIGPRAGAVWAFVLLAAGNLAFLGLMAAPDLLHDLGRSADRLSLRESAKVSAEAFESVQNRYGKLDTRLRTTELFLARVAILVSVPLPAGLLAPAEEEEALTPDRLEGNVLRLSRRLRTLELFRRAVAEAPVAGAANIPSRSPVEPSAAGAIHERLTVPAELPVEAATPCMAAGQVIKVPKPGSRMLLAEVQLDAPMSATEATR